MKGRHCTNTKGTCTKAHIPNLAGLPKADQDWLVNLVKNDKVCTFVEGKGPKITVNNHHKYTLVSIYTLMTTKTTNLTIL